MVFFFFFSGVGSILGYSNICVRTERPFPKLFGFLFDRFVSNYHISFVQMLITMKHNNISVKKMLKTLDKIQ